MNIILLSGGSGKRLWPLSNDVRSKQFIKIFNKNGEYESMVQRVYQQIKAVDKDAVVTVATSKSQVSAIHNQLGESVGISVEPCRRDTFPAIILACAYLHDVQNVAVDDAVVVCPVDPYVDDGYFTMLEKLCEQARVSTANMMLMGIEPTYPSEKYGYIIPETQDEISAVKTFKEKPTTEVAKEYIAQGALWNSGVFAFKLGYVLSIAEKVFGTAKHAELYARYTELEKISFDYAVVEKESDIKVIRYNGEWKDIGTWNTLTEVMNEPIIGDGRMDDECSNVHVLNELGLPILAMGLHDVVISAGPDGILVSDKERSGYIKSYVEKIDQQVMFAEKSWGSYHVLDLDDGAMIVKIILHTSHRMNYHNHQQRDEVWAITAGIGRTIVDGMEQPVKAGDVITIQAGCKHTIIADSELKLIEIQLGQEISVHDKQKFAMPK